MIAATHGAELCARVRQLLALLDDGAVGNRVEHRMIGDALLVLAPHAERDGTPDLIYRPRHVDVGSLDRRLHRAVPAADVVANARGHHYPVGRHYAADRHRVALVMIGA